MRISLITLLAGLPLMVACGSDKQGDDEQVVDGGTPDGSFGRLDGSLDSMDARATNADAAPLADGSSPGVLPDGSPFMTNAQGQVLCGTEPCKCSNGVDDDSDGLSDLADPECVSSWDNDEATFATGIPGDNRDPFCQDCFFDGNSGSGNDGCRVATSCLTNANDSSSGSGACATCTANDKCRSSCQAYTPNGCDCFGCCTVHLGSNITKNVLLSPTCDINGTTTTGCTECVPSTSCGNACGECELCPGKTLADLPAKCNVGSTPDGGTPPAGDAGSSDAGVPVPSCDDGQQACGGSVGCPSGQLCQFGCCQLTPILL